MTLGFEGGAARPFEAQGKREAVPWRFAATKMLGPSFVRMN